MAAFEMEDPKRHRNVRLSRVSSSSSGDSYESFTRSNMEDAYTSDESEQSIKPGGKTYPTERSSTSFRSRKSWCEENVDRMSSKSDLTEMIKPVWIEKKQFMLRTNRGVGCNNDITTNVNKRTIKNMSTDLDLAEYDGESKRQKCFSRNAIMARNNRLKKKKYIETLENQVSDLNEENLELKKTKEKNSVLISSLRNEIRYLKSVLANSKEISMLLKSVKHNTGLPVTTSFKHRSHHDGNFDSSKLLSGELNDIVDENELFGSIESAEPENNFDLSIPSCYPFLFSPDIPLPMSSDNDFLGLQPSSTDILDAEVPRPKSVLPPLSVDCDESLTTSAGVCLHIAKHKVSLEFCATCSNNAMAAWEEDVIY